MKTKTYEEAVFTSVEDGTQWHLTQHWGRPCMIREELSMEFDGTMNVRTILTHLDGTIIRDKTKTVAPITLDVANEWDSFEPKWTQHLERTPALADALFS